MSATYDHIFDTRSFQAELVFAGTRCNPDNLLRNYRTGALHFVRSGVAEVLAAGRPAQRIDQPSLVFFPHAGAHSLRAVEDDGFELVCAFTSFGEGFSRAVALSLPDVVVLPLAQLHAIRHTLEALFAEAGSNAPGSKQLADRLCEVVLAYVARHAVEAGEVHPGVLAASGDLRIAAAVRAIHAQFDQELDVDALAREAGMSRSRFGERFKAVVGESPHSYLVRHRIGVAQQMLARKVPVKTVAGRVGYATASAFVRKFRQVVGVSPAAWAR
ncbi:MAG: helix-turn-helix transcriptional regulator [Burkholderiales bacterium]|nr:helix-turn-helix transcriptional regulator [Burkholderiales bacterium]